MYFCENCNAELELPLDGRCPACGAGKRRLRRFGVRDYNEKPTPVYKTNTHRDESPRRRPNPKTMVILAALLALGGASAVFFLVAGPGEPVQGLSDDTYVEIWRETYEERGSSPEAWDEALSEYGTNLEEFDEFTRELRDDNSRYNEISAEINEDPAAAAPTPSTPSNSAWKKPSARHASNSMTASAASRRCSMSCYPKSRGSSRSSPASRAKVIEPQKKFDSV